MDTKAAHYLTHILIVGSILYFFVLLIIAQIRYSIFLDYVRKVKPDFKENLNGLWVTEKGGGWIGNTYWFRTPLPISIKTHNAHLKQLVDAHDRIIRFFWISVVTVLPLVIITLHIINK